LENLAGAILKGDSAAILSSIEKFDSAGKNMRRIAGELLMHFRNLVVLMALGAKSKSLTATPDQIRVLEEQAQGADPGRIFRVCDQLAELEDKLRHVLSVRTLIEMSLIRASRIATTATIEELLKAVRALKEDGAGAILAAPAAVPFAGVAENKVVPPSAPAPTPKAEASKPIDDMESRRAILDDPKLNEMLGDFPGSGVVDIRNGNNGFTK
jgi:DNA polymerase-3 subunit gamma/tau